MSEPMSNEERCDKHIGNTTHKFEVHCRLKADHDGHCSDTEPAPEQEAGEGEDGYIPWPEPEVRHVRGRVVSTETRPGTLLSEDATRIMREQPASISEPSTTEGEREEVARYIYEEILGWVGWRDCKGRCPAVWQNADAIIDLLTQPQEQGERVFIKPHELADLRDDVKGCAIIESREQDDDDPDFLRATLIIHKQDEVTQPKEIYT